MVWRPALRRKGGCSLSIVFDVLELTDWCIAGQAFRPFEESNQTASGAPEHDRVAVGVLLRVAHVRERSDLDHLRGVGNGAAILLRMDGIAAAQQKRGRQEDVLCHRSPLYHPVPHPDFPPAPAQTTRRILAHMPADRDCASVEG